MLTMSLLINGTKQNHLPLEDQTMEQRINLMRQINYPLQSASSSTSDFYRFSIQVYALLILVKPALNIL